MHHLWLLFQWRLLKISEKIVDDGIPIHLDCQAAECHGKPGDNGAGGTGVLLQVEEQEFHE